jgi:hypothetical protein
MSANGQLKDSELARIPGGRLALDAAAAFNAMNEEAHRRFGRGIGITDSYRPLGHQGDLDRGVWSQWAAWERYQRGGNLAADPGTSNHGRGDAVDLTRDGRWIVDQIGHAFGWAKEWSDAPGEWWHVTFRPGIWHPNPLPFLPLHVGIKGVQHTSVGAYVWLLTHRLGICHYLPRSQLKYDARVQIAVRAYQAHHHLAIDGIVGPVTWNAVRASSNWCRKHNRGEV